MIPSPHSPLPPLRQDLGLFTASPDHDGTPAWSLHDPAANRFYRLGWAAFEILSRWSLGTPAAILHAIHSETTLQLDVDDIQGVMLFLEQNFLTEATQAADSEKLLRSYNSQQLHWSKWLLKNYLFFRIPLIRPDAYLQRIAPWFGCFFHPVFWLGMGVATVCALYLVFRQWEVFSHSFTAYHNWQAALAFALALSFSKVIHELGHAIATRRHGCQVPAMGIAFLVLWPVLYTDTTEAWKLPSRRARLQIGIAGIAAELCLAVAATYLWFLLPDGPIRAATFFLATTTWLLTLAINASPFMRFDGYFLLSDLLGLPNLHSRAFALGRWWLREKLFGLKLAVPEQHSPALHKFLIVFAISTWLYRLVLFFSIALLVYHFFFKALGIFLMLVEIGWFILRPLADEIRVWLQLRKQIHWNRNTSSAGIVLLLTLAWLSIPWQTEISAPAVLSPAQEQTLYASRAAQLQFISQQTQVKTGDVLLKLTSPELESNIKIAQQRESALRWQKEQQSFSNQLLQQGGALYEHWQEARAELDGLLAEQAKLTIRAPFDGEILIRNDEVHIGSWVSNREMLLVLADAKQVKLEAFVSEQNLGRLHLGNQARFVPDISEIGRVDCQITMIDPVNLTELEEPIVSTVHGGNLATHVDNRSMQTVLRPTNTTYRVTLQQCSPNTAPQYKVRGTVLMAAQGQSLLSQITQQVLRSLIKEGGF